MDGAAVDGVIRRLLEVKGKPGKQIQLSEAEIKQLCVTAREILLSQPVLLQLESPLKICAVIDDKTLCMHGGISPELHNLDQIRQIERLCVVPDSGLLCDLLWSDPSCEVPGWGAKERGVLCTFGSDKVKEFLQNYDLDLICRAHQVVEDGYEFFANRQLVTIFSAPNYCGEFDNVMMSVDENLLCSFQILKTTERKGKFCFSKSGMTSTPIKALF